LSLLKNFSAGGNKNIQFRVEAFNAFNHANVSFNNDDNENLNLGSLNFAITGKPLTTGMLENPNFGIANIKYGSSPIGGRLIELGAKFTF
jgi:hypothetical protein